MENKKKVILILSTIVILIALFGGAFIVNKMLNKKSNIETPKEEEKQTSSITDDFSKNDASALSEKGNELLNLLQLNEIHSCSATTTNAIYYKKSYTKDNMPDGLKIYLGIMQYKDSRNFATSKSIILTKEEVRTGVEKVFGPDVKYKDTSYGTKACIGSYDAFTYDDSTGNYTITPTKCDCDASKGEIIAKPINSTETDNEITVTQKILISVPSFNSETNKTTFKLFNTFDFKKEPLAEAETFSFSEFEDKLIGYTFVFKKHKNGKYYFESISQKK